MDSSSFSLMPSYINILPYFLLQEEGLRRVVENKEQIRFKSHRIYLSDPTYIPIGSWQEQMKIYIYNLARSLIGDRVLKIESYMDIDYGVVVKVITDLSAREALELWLKIVNHLKQEKYDVIVVVEWVGKQDVSEDELIDYIVRIMLKSGLKPKALPGFDAVRIIREERGE
ncbi:MAG: hypothetical protein QXQ57_00440 [Sulfolobales archaeon]